MSSKIDNIQNTPSNIDTQGKLWVDREFSHPERTIRLATSFSGIGSPEQALKQLGVEYNILFAGDIDEYCKQT